VSDTIEIPAIASTEELHRVLADYERRIRALQTQLEGAQTEHRRYSAMVGYTDAGLLVFNSSLKVTWASESFFERFSPSTEAGEVLGSPCNKVMCRREKICDRCPSLAPFTSGMLAHHEFLADIGGRQRHIYASGMPILSSEGDIEETIVMLQDVSELKVLRLSQQALKSSEERFRSIFEKAAVGMATFGPDGRFLQVNPALCRFLGYLDAELARRSVWDVTHPDDLAECRRLFAEVTAGRRRVVEMEKRFIRKDGETAWGHVTEAWLFDPSMTPAYSVALVQDVNERRRAEEARQRLATAVEQAGESIMITDPDGVIKYVNPAFERITGFSRAEVLGKTPRILKSGHHDIPFYRDLWNRVRRGEIWAGRFVNRRKDGTLYHEETTISPVRDISGRIVNYVSAARDVTQELALQNQLMQSQKMEAIGTLAGGVAHDFNNILTGILGHAQLLRIEGGTNERVLQAAETIEKASHRAAELTRALLGFARRGKHQNVPVDLHGTIQEVIGLLGPTLDKNIEIKCHFSEDGVTAVGDPGQLQQVILNLAVNARDAMPRGGTLTFTTSFIELDAEEGSKQGVPGAGRYVVLAVADTGTGITDEIRTRIFDPFFTTKERGKGTGMGLAMVYGIVKNHGGVIRLESEVGRGTIFSIYLPAIDAAGPAELPPRADNPVTGAGRILVVDDEDVVRDVAAGFLKHLGYECLMASDGQAALDCYTARRGEIDLVLIDMIMPRMGGRECFRALKAIDPNVRAVLTTGYGFNEAAQELIDEGVAGFVQKPYELTQLSEVVAKAIQDRSR